MKRLLLTAILAVGLLGTGCGPKNEITGPPAEPAAIPAATQTESTSPIGAPDSGAAAESTEATGTAETGSNAGNENGSGSGTVPSGSVDPLGESDLSLGKIILGSSLADYKKIVPQEPTATAVENDPDLEIEKKTLEYKGLTVILLNDTVYSAESTQGTWATSRGLKVGDDSKVVVSKYGEPNSKNGDQWVYLYNEEYSVFFVTVQGGKVTKIRVSQVM